jgi:hypothetical protein
VPSCSSNLERLGFLALLVHVNQLTWLYAERWAVNALSVNKDVTVNNKLTSLCDCASKTCTQDDCVKTHL